MTSLGMWVLLEITSVEKEIQKFTFADSCETQSVQNTQATKT